MDSEQLVVLLAEDDCAHAEVVRRTLESFRLPLRLEHVSDGQAALDYLYRRAGFQDCEHSPRPRLILLDLRMPRVDGLEVLKIIKADPELAYIPAVILTTSAAEADVLGAYKHKANSYLVKPVDFSRFVELLHALGDYWLECNQNPRPGEGGTFGVSCSL